MIIALNQKPMDRAWGGGNRFLHAIAKEMETHGHKVIHDLKGDIDVILMTETRPRSPGVTFHAGNILRYLSRHPKTIVVHRINECDERKGERFITHKLLRANYAADKTVFVASWLKDLPAWKNKSDQDCAVILNGADQSIFHDKGFQPWTGQGPLRLITHHWGAHRFKGFDVYERIDHLLDDPPFSARFLMTYLGNLPAGYTFKNIRHIPPLNGEELARELRSHHAYLTGSINEPGGNHQNEGACCGLPVAYRNSGCMPEYLGGYGLMYEGPDDVQDALNTLYANYDRYAQAIQSYPHTAARMAGQWRNFLEKAVAEVTLIAEHRQLWRNPYLYFRNQIPV